MKVLICGDLHYSEFSSIIRKKGVRLQNCVDTLNWVERLSETQHCSKVIYLGDFFDKPELNSEELTYLTKVKWSNLDHYVLVGNHEMGASDLSCSSTHVLGCLTNFKVVNEPLIESISDCSFLFLPYILEDKNRKLKDIYLNGFIKDRPLIVFSHNDIKGIQMGQFISKEGFDIKDLEDNCDLFFNGHIHNGGFVGKNILNVGNITGQNFSEDASKYNHQVVILDTETHTLSFCENPYAFNFYKLEIKSKNDFNNICIKNNSVFSIKTSSEMPDELKRILDSLKDHIVEYRVVVDRSNTPIIENKIQELTSIDHIEEFKKYIVSQLGTDEAVIKELQEL